MTESSSTPNLDREKLTAADSLNVEELQKKLTKEIVKNALLQAKVEHLEDKNDCLAKELTKSNEMYIVINKKIDYLTLKMVNLNNIEDQKKIDELTFELKKLKEGKQVCFLYLPNKWKFIDSRWPCCEKKCINADNLDVFCMNGNGFIQVNNNGTNVEYLNCRKEKGTNKGAVVNAENRFIKPSGNSGLLQCCLNCSSYLFFYYEVKIQMEEKTSIKIGFRKDNDTFIRLWPKEESIYYYSQNKHCYIKLPLFSIKNDDIIGCGLVYPPSKINNKLPYAFFTKNGEQIGKAVLLKDNHEFYQAYLSMIYCSVETNFGKDLESKPFLYNISKHCVAEEFYKDEEFIEYK